ncbi:mitochondrial antiviral-signaling protein [Colossoma macropomum]|uniref:mitochondrial antiviral-signaling protein n=1 Tax=Colossoma macropomum TaxID=42526 RepID=UPI00186517D9|nr:mitochondrial antiviral-signaling protein [Colossoma macropomum]XP_036429849.1 mitochondrial antiviral-signaling protein [Colossoma macropomum]
MTYASDKLYNEVIKRMMARLASLVKVREIIPYLPCLTLTDREEIEAKRENAGNYSAMILLLDCLRRRENWPEEFIAALRDCEHLALADEIGNAYDRIRGINTQRTAPAAVASASGPASATGPAPAVSAAVATASPPAPVPVPVTTSAATPSPAQSPATTVTTATIHNAPHSIPPLLTPSPGEAPAQAAAPVPVHSPPESLPSIAAPGPAEPPATVPTRDASAAPPREPAQPSEPSPLVSTPQAEPPSPVSASKVTPSIKQNEVSFNPGVTPSLDSSDDLTLTAVSEASSAAATSLSTNTVTTSPSQPNTLSTSCQPPASHEESKIPLAVAESSTSVKHPIQDTSPPENETVLEQNSNTNATVSQFLETVQTTVLQNSQAPAASPETAQVLPSASNDAVAGLLSHTAAIHEEYFSKPGTLMEPSLESYDDLQISRPPTVTAGSSPVQPIRPAPVSRHPQPEEQSEEPCSVTSNELMFSRSTAGITSSSITQDSQHSPPEHVEVPTEPVPVSDLTAAAENLVPHSTPEENSFPEGDAAFSHNQPVEDHYESFSQSLQAEPGTLVNVVQVSEEPSILNLNGQPPSMIGISVRPNNKEVNLNRATQAESPLQSVVSEDQPKTLQNQGIAQCTQRNEGHASPAATSTYQELGFNSSRLMNPPKSEQREEAEKSQGVLSQLQRDPRLIAATAAVGVAILAMAWKLKH